jgi:hypothetical protein
MVTDSSRRAASAIAPTVVFRGVGRVVRQELEPCVFVPLLARFGQRLEARG